MVHDGNRSHGFEWDNLARSSGTDACVACRHAAGSYTNKKAVLSPAQCAPYMDALKNSGLPDYVHGYFSPNFSRAFVLIDPMNVRTKFEVRSLNLPGPEIIGGTPKKLGSSWICPRSVFSKIFNGL